jgi:hypothetical protein
MRWVLTSFHPFLLIQSQRRLIIIVVVAVIRIHIFERALLSIGLFSGTASLSVAI